MRYLLDFILSLVKLLLGNAWNRSASLLIVGGIAMLNGWAQYVIVGLFAVGGHKITIPDTPTWISFALIAIGVLLLVGNRLLPETITQAAEPHPHDIRLLQSFREKVGPPLVDFLRDHNFRIPFIVKRLDPLEDISYSWKGAHYEFQDVELQEKLTEVLKINRDFLNLTAERIFVDRHNVELGSPLTDMDRAHGISQGTIDAIGQMNHVASQLVEAIDNLERLAKAKIPQV